MKNNLNQLTDIFSSAKFQTIPIFDATTMTSSLIILKENRRQLTKTHIEFYFSDLEGTTLVDVDATIEQCKLTPIQPCQ